MVMCHITISSLLAAAPQVVAAEECSIGGGGTPLEAHRQGTSNEDIVLAQEPPLGEHKGCTSVVGPKQQTATKKPQNKATTTRGKTLHSTYLVK